MRRAKKVTNPIDDLADVLKALAGKRQSGLGDQVETLRLAVERLGTTVALQELQIAKLRESVAAIVLDKE